MKKGKKKD